MITAKEARELVEQSEANITWYLERLGAVITEQANLGNKVLYPRHASGCGHDIFEVEKRPYRAAEMTGIQKKIAERLKTYGYGVTLEEYTVRVGGGLGSMDDEVREEPASRFKIAW